MLKPQKLILSSFFLLIAAACSKSLYKHELAGCKFRLTKDAQMLIGKKWSETSIESIRLGEDSSYKNITGQFIPSDLDDVIVFNKSGTYVFDEGKTKARAGSAQVYEQGNWCICKGGDRLILGSGPSITSYQVIRLEKDVLVLRLMRTKNERADAYLLTYQPVE